MIKIYIVLILVITLLDIRRYYISVFKEETNLNYFSVILDREIYKAYEVFKQLELIKGHSKVLGNLYLPIDEGINKIDSIFIHETGLYILLTKDYKGFIKGGEKDENWSYEAKKNKNASFPNPVIENRENIVALKKMLKLSEKYFASIIAFNNRSKIKYINVKPEKAIVLKKKSIRKALKFIVGPSNNILSEEKVLSIYNELKPYSKPYKE